jgi:DamX protein
MQGLELRKHHASPLMSQAFKPCAWLANIDFIKRLIAINHLLIVVMGDVRSGKSTFVDLMRFKFEPNIKTVLLQAEKDESESMLLACLSTLFNVSFETNDATFESFFENCPVAKQPVLLVIDNAQLLTGDCLHQLTTAYKQHAAAKRFYLCLVADFSLLPQLRHLEQASFKHFIHTIEPGSLTEAETKTYVMRYATGQNGGAALLSPERFKAFYATTQGNIAAIHEQLQILNDVKPKEKKRGRVIWTLAPSLVLALAVVVGIGVNRQSTPLISKLTPIPILDTTELIASYVAPWYAGAEIQPVQPPPLQKYAEALVQEDEVQVDEKLALIDKVVVIPEVHAEPETDKKQVQLRSVLPTHPTHAQKPGYTIQLLAAKNVRELHEFIKAHHLSGESTQIRQVWKEHVRWYVLTMGGYPQLAQAQIAAQRLPQPLKTLKPWVRSDAQLEEVG